MQKTSLSSNDCSKATSKSEVISQLNNKKLLQLKKFVVMEKTNKQTNRKQYLHHYQYLTKAYVNREEDSKYVFTAFQ